jgi:hypothetical protein
LPAGKRETKIKTFARVLLVFGLVMIALSLMLRAANQPGSPEETVSTLNIYLGALMVLFASGYLVYWKKKNSSREGQPPAMQAKGGQDSENTQPPHQVS